MSNPIQEALEPLAEMPGWQGSLLLAASGTVLAQAGENWLGADAAPALATRLSRLFESFGSVGEEASFAVLRFPARALLIRPVLDSFLIVAAAPAAGVPLLKTGIAMSVKRITAFAERQAEGEAASPQGSEETPSEDGPGYERVYRGIRVG